MAGKVSVPKDMKGAVVNLAWLGERDGAGVIHATNPPPEGEPNKPLCNSPVKNALTVEVGTLGEVTCQGCLGTLDFSPPPAPPAPPEPPSA